MRPLVSYDDIASQVPEQASPPPNSGAASPPKKRRKNNPRQSQRQIRKDYGLQEESRQLTHQEVWDDSALVRAWDAAVEEYEVLNGPEKKWKSEPVNKSLLWYNIPPEQEEPPTSSPDPSFLTPSMPATFTSDSPEAEDELEPNNSRPVDFNTFVPKHDPSLPNGKGAGVKMASGSTGAWRGIVPPAPAMSSQATPDEAFEHAMGAWYWAGYWTGVYHTAVKKTMLQEYGQDPHEDEAMVDTTGLDEEVEEEELIPT